VVHYKHIITFNINTLLNLRRGDSHLGFTGTARFICKKHHFAALWRKR